MVRKLPLHLRRERTRHGTVVYFVRVSHGPRVRIRDAFDTPEFWDAYRTALQGKPAEARASKPENKAGSLAWLVARYMASADWSNEISAATRKQRGAIYRAVNAKIGDKPYKAVTKAKITEGRERRKEKPHAANNFLKAMRALFGWAVKNEHLEVDPTIGVKLLSTDNPEGFHTWDEDEVAKFEAKWPIGTRERLAMDLLLYTGLRRGDVVRIGRPHVRRGLLTIRTEKTEEVVILPVLPPLQASIDATQGGELTFLATSRGQPFDKASFGNWFAKKCKEAGVPGRAHGLRKCGAVRAAEGGATEAQMNAIFGWAEGSKESSTYIKKADRARRAAAAAQTLLPTPKPEDQIQEEEAQPVNAKSRTM